MPFDSSTHVEVTAPDLTSPSLAGLAWVLRHREAWPTGHVWDFSHCDRCAMGIALKLWPTRCGVRGLTEVTADDRRYLFGSDAYAPTSRSRVTPEMVADRLDVYRTRRASR